MIAYQTRRDLIELDGDAKHFLLTDGRGNYLALGAPNVSNYDGWFFRRDDTYWKVLSNIAPNSPLRKLWICENEAKREFEDGTKQRFALAPSCILLDQRGTSLLTLDCKRRYDETEQERHYVYTRTPAAHLFRYAKGTDSPLFIAVVTALACKPCNEWREESYPYDDMRGTHSTRWVYDALTLSGEGRVMIGIGESETEAVENARGKELPIEMPERVALAGPRIQLAWRALSSVLTDRGILAGMPWFTQVWSRDELIASGGFIASGQLDIVRSILGRWHTAVRPDGTLPAIHPDKGLVSADAPGWLGRRTLDYLAAGGHLEPDECKAWADAQERLLDALQVREGLVWSERNETWMDTAWEDEGRAGARVEIQALAITLAESYLRLCKRIGKEPKHQEVIATLSAAVESRLVHRGLLLDGLHPDGSIDTTLRPNVFIARIIAPNLVSDDCWRRTYHAILPELWRDWGGLSSLSCKAPIFQERYSGEDVRSYHRGDSWYWVNNMAAMAMLSIDANEFSTPIRNLKEASVQDMLEKGYAGHCSEISSAIEQIPAGCWGQAWSASTLLELLFKTE